MPPRIYLPGLLPLLSKDKPELEDGTNSWIPDKLSFFSWVDVKFEVLLLLLPLLTPPIPSKEALDEERLRPEKFLLISEDPEFEIPWGPLSGFSCGGGGGPCIVVALWRGWLWGGPRSVFPWRVENKSYVNHKRIDLSKTLSKYSDCCNFLS